MKKSLFMLFAFSFLAAWLIVAKVHAELEFDAEMEDIPGLDGEVGKGITARAGSEYLFKADVDEGGEFDEFRAYVGLGTETRLNERWNFNFNFTYLFASYDFSDKRGSIFDIEGEDLWNNVHFFTITAPVTYHLKPRWLFSASPIFHINYEPGASLDDSYEIGGFLSVARNLGKRLTLGVGGSILRKLDGDAGLSWFPIIIWQIPLMDNLRFVTHSSISRGFGGELIYAHSLQWQFSLGASSRSKRFGTDNDLRDAGIGNVSGVPVWGGVHYQFTKNLKLELYGGWTFNGELELQDSDGDTVAESDFDPAPKLGISLTGNF